jgi:hypothetical protein
MTNLTEIKNFAIDNPPKSKIGFDHNGTWIVNPWYDPSYRYYLNNEEAVAEYGFENILNFIEMAEKEMERWNTDIQNNLKAILSAPKQKFIVDIEEAIVNSVEVEADNIIEAMEIAEEKYNKGEFVLGGDADVAYRQMRASSEDFMETTEWTEF